MGVSLFVYMHAYEHTHLVNTHSNYFFHVLELIRLFGPTTSQPVDIDGNRILQAGSLASQFCPLGPKERCTPSQAQAMGEQILGLMAMHESNGTPLPCKSTFIYLMARKLCLDSSACFFFNLVNYVCTCALLKN